MVEPLSSAEPHVFLPDHCNGPTDLRIKTESDEPLNSAGRAGPPALSLDQNSAAPITSQSSLLAVMAAGSEAVSTAPGTQLHVA